MLGSPPPRLCIRGLCWEQFSWDSSGTALRPGLDGCMAVGSTPPGSSCRRPSYWQTVLPMGTVGGPPMGAATPGGQRTRPQQ